jgi:hypothetical protein
MSENQQAKYLVQLWNKVFPFTNTRPLTRKGKMADQIEEKDEAAFLQLAEGYKLSPKNLESIIWFFKEKQQFYRPHCRISHLFIPKPETPYIMLINHLLFEWQKACESGEWSASMASKPTKPVDKKTDVIKKIQTQLQEEADQKKFRKDLVEEVDKWKEDTEQKRKARINAEIERILSPPKSKRLTQPYPPSQFNSPSTFE